MTPHPIPVFRSPYPPNYFPYSHYFSPYFMPPGIHQFLGHSGFPQQTPTGNIYLPTPAAAPAAGGTKFSIPQYKPGSNTGNSTHIGIPTVSEDLTPSQLKDNNSYATGQQVGVSYFASTCIKVILFRCNKYRGYMYVCMHVCLSFSCCVYEHMKDMRQICVP